MNFILYSSFFEKIYIAIFALNLLIMFVEFLKISFENTKSDYMKLKSEPNKTMIFKIGVACGYILLTTLLLYLRFKDILVETLVFIILTFSMIKLFDDLAKEKKNTNFDDKYTYLTATIVFIGFGVDTSKDIVSTIINLEPIARDSWILIFVTLKLIIFIFAILINLYIICDKIIFYFISRGSQIPLKINSTIRNYSTPFYDFKLSKKNSTTYAIILDSIIFILLFPICFLFYLFYIVSNKVFLIFKNLCKRTVNLLYTFCNNKNKIIKKIMKIAIIGAFSFTYVFALYSQEYANTNAIDAYVFLATVIVIPLLIDSIKKRNPV